MSYKQFRVTSDGFRKSVREEMSLKFERDEELFLKILKEKGYPSRGSQITRESQIFDNISSSMPLFLLEQVENKRGTCTAERFVCKIIDTIQTFHLDNKEDQVEIDTQQSYQAILSDIYDKTAAEEHSKPLSCFMEIYHIKNSDLVTDIFRYYQIKYKARLIKEDNISQVLSNLDAADPVYKSIYEQKSSKLWKEPFNEKVTHLEIAVFGRLKPQYSEYSQNNSNITNSSGSNINNTLENESKDEGYNQISKVVVDFKLIYACIHPKTLENPKNQEQTIINTKVNVQYKDQTSNAPFKGLTTIQMGFNFILDSETRLLVMDRLLDYFADEIHKLEYQISERVTVINEILSPFKDAIVYKPSRGLEENKQIESRNGCSIQQCSIF